MKSYAVPLLKTRRAELSNSTCRVEQFDVSSWQRWHAELTKMARRVGKDGVPCFEICYRESFDFRRASAAEDQTPRSATSRVCRV